MPTKLGIVDITPDPQILTAITYSPLRPIEALCELIDNSIDAFLNSLREGNQIKPAMINIEIPTVNELQKGVGKIVIKDNGRGMTQEQAQRAVTAGFSGQGNRWDNLGLFGMGFNIASGKLGNITILKTSIVGEDDWTILTLDLKKMKRIP